MGWGRWGGAGEVGWGRWGGHTWVWVGGVALKEHSGATIAEWAIHHVGVACDPTNVCHTRKYIILLRVVVKGVLHVHTQTYTGW